MKRLGLLLVSLFVMPVAVARAEVARFAVLVGANHGDVREVPLRYAESDAVRMSQTLRSLGGFAADRVLLMTAPTASELRDALVRLNARIREHREAVLLVYYSGHADEEALHLAGTHLPTAELKALLVGSPATSRVLIVDACRSGALSRVKGVRPAPTFSVPLFDPSVPEGFAILTSSASTEDSQESGSLRASYFTHYLHSALIGAADQNRDGAVTLSETFAFASHETRAATVGSAAGPQTPTYQFMLGGRQDLVITRPGHADARLGRMSFAQSGRYMVQRWDVGGLTPPVAEVAARDEGLEVALPPGKYRVTLRSDRDVSERDYLVEGGRTTTVVATQMARIDVGRMVRKGGPRRSVTGVAAAIGGHADRLGGGELALGAGPTVAVALRHDRQRWALETRLSWGQGTTSTPASGVRMRNQVIAPTISAFVPFDWRTLTVSLGAEVGLAIARQSYQLDDLETTRQPLPYAGGKVAPSWSTGLQVGPLVQVDLPVGPRLYLRLEAAAPFRAFGSRANHSAESGRALTAQLLMGALAYF
jgi:hypothetical protein